MSDVQAVPANANASEAGGAVRAGKNSQATVLDHAANELVFAVVGHVGSGTSTVALALKELLSLGTTDGAGYDVIILKGREVIQEWATVEGHALPTTDASDLDTVEKFQDLGDRMRFDTKDHAAVAKGTIKRIRRTRAQKIGIAEVGDGPVRPDGGKRAYIIDSIRHPAEVALLRHVYQDAFILVGVVCEEERRLRRVMKKYANAGEAKAKAFMKRDEKAKEKHGQRVSDAFYLSDYFLDNTVERLLADGVENENWDINEKLSRLLKIISHEVIVRPEPSETAMHHAHSAAMRSACLSRQVGAALMDGNGNIIATGTNEVPQAGGGVYGESFDSEAPDHRCAFRKTGTKAYCSNTKKQNEIVATLIAEIPELNILDPIRKNALGEEIRKGGIGDLLEFSRAVHAEMDALLSAAREAISTVGTKLFVTTFPCHYCARHIVSAGVYEVQFIEPYPKSQALGLHADAIQLEASEWTSPGEGGAKVLFRPFVGVAPRLYRRAFFKDRELKDSKSGEFLLGAPEWGTPWHLRDTGYAELEAAVVRD